MATFQFKNILISQLLLILLFPLALLAGNTKFIKPQYQYIQPVGSLNQWFKGSTTSYALALGWGGSHNWQYSINFEVLPFNEPNKDRLKYDDLSLKLEITGSSVTGQYFLRPAERGLNPYLLWNIGVYRWFAERGSYIITDENADESILVPGRNQNDWSWGFSIGAGSDIYKFKNLILSTGIKYRIIIAELWPALALDLENVSGMQMLIGKIGISVYF